MTAGATVSRTESRLLTVKSVTKTADRLEVAASRLD